MTFLVILAVIILALFGLVFFTRRRMGVLGLALAAGAMLATMWVGELTPIIASAGVVIIQPPLESLVSSFLILLPAILLLSNGAKYTNPSQRIIGATTFALLAIALLLPSIGSALVIDDTGRPIYDFFDHYRTLIVTVGLTLSILDIISTKLPKRSGH
jgi:hypothetical protein